MKRELVERAREFRAAPTRSEAMPWDVLRDRQFIVEADGSVHDTRREHDNERQQLLESAGYQVIRFSAEDIETNMPVVLSTISTYLNSPSPSPDEI